MKVWRAIPFIFELKTILDWTFTKTSLHFYYWIKLEDIHATLFRRKVELDNLKKYPPTETVTNWSKLFAGFLLFVGIISLIFFPLFFFSNLNPTTLKYNSVQSVQLSLGVDGFLPFYYNQFIKLNLNDVIERRDMKDSNIFSDHDDNPFQSFIMSQWSETNWQISNPSRYIEILKKGKFKKNIK
jgi:piezo-type mechanosensitive ion channel component 1/2